MNSALRKLHEQHERRAKWRAFWTGFAELMLWGMVLFLALAFCAVVG